MERFTAFARSASALWRHRGRSFATKACRHSTGSIPSRESVDPKQLLAWKVETDGAQLIFRALYRGTLVDEAFSDRWTGKTLREITPPSLQPAIIGASEHCVSTGCAVYTVLRTHGGAGFTIELSVCCCRSAGTVASRSSSHPCNWSVWRGRSSAPRSQRILKRNRRPWWRSG